MSFTGAGVAICGVTRLLSRPMTGKRRLRRAGARWRLLAHDVLDGKTYGLAHHVQDDWWDEGDGAGEHSTVKVLPRTEFDELVVGQWLHVEQMDTGRWWMNIGGVTVWVKADRDGQPLSVTVRSPGQGEDNPVEGCTYTVT